MAFARPNANHEAELPSGLAVTFGPATGIARTRSITTKRAVLALARAVDPRGRKDGTGDHNERRDIGDFVAYAAADLPPESDCCAPLWQSSFACHASELPEQDNRRIQTIATSEEGVARDVPG